MNETHMKLMDFENCFQVEIDSGRLPEPAQYSKKQTPCHRPEERINGVVEETKKPATMMDFHNVLNKRKKQFI